MTKKQSEKTNARTGDLPNIGAPAKRALAAAGITRLEKLTRVSEAELLKLHGLGPKAVRLLRESLLERGMKFAASGASQSVSARANQKIERRKLAPKT